MTLFKHPVVNDDNLVTAIENKVLHHVPFGRIFQVDGVPPHFSHRILTFLNMEFSTRWLGTGEHILWPLRSPGLTPAFFILGVCKGHFYRQNMKGVKVWRERIIRAAECITKEILVSTW
jgi:hypothetical protein